MDKCVVCGTECSGKTCSGACRAKLSRQAHGQAHAVGAHAPRRTVKDCTGAEHPIDYEGRRKNYALLKSWAEGKGTAMQQIMGRLAMTYNVIKGLDVNHYLGLAA